MKPVFVGSSRLCLPFVTGVVVVFCHLVNRAFSNDPCLDSVNIGDYRRSKAYVPTAEDPMLCDANINETLWYRFDAYTGGKMSETCVTAIHCGTFLPIWMNGVHPTATEPGPKTVDVCSPSWFGAAKCCQWRGSISVRWCQNTTTQREYFVYRLQRPPYCSMSYCAGDWLPCAKSCSWNGARNICVCPAYPKMTDAPELNPPRVVTGSAMVMDIYGQTFFPTRFQFDCEVRYPRQTLDDGARFDVVFELNGYFLASFTVNSTNPVATLDESYLIGKLGKQLTCKVSSFWDSSDVGSRYLLSNGHWLGLTPIDKTGAVIRNNVVVKEGEITRLWLQSSFPITTRPCFDVPEMPCPYASYMFSVTPAENVLRLTDCTMVFGQTSNRSVELEISPVPEVGTRPKPVIWQLNFEKYQDTAMNLPVPDEMREKFTPIFKDYQIQGINIEVTARDEPPICKSTGDPHVTTFRSAEGDFYNIYGVGDFYLVKLPLRGLEIQVRHAPCGPDVSCNCGVMAREGNSIIGITKCGQSSPLLIQYQLDKISPVGSIHTIQQGTWKISLLSGMVIEVFESGLFFLDVHVTGLRSEMDQYEGLCSAPVPANSNCTQSCEQYRVPDSQSFFSMKSLPQCGQPYIVPRCSCSSVERYMEDSITISCDDPNGDYLLKIDLTHVCGKRKRSADDEYESSSNDDAISLEDFLYNPNPPPPAMTRTRTTTQPQATLQPGIGLAAIQQLFLWSARLGIEEKWQYLSTDDFGSHFITSEKAITRCRNSLNLSPTYSRCLTKVNATNLVDACALDIQSLNNYSPADSIPTQFERACLNNIRVSLDSFSAKDMRAFQELKALLTQVESLVCPSQCSQQGRCSNGVCQCNSDYMGSDCSLRKGQVPSITRIISPFCDIRKRSCKIINVQATDVTSPENVFCKMRSVDGPVGETPAVQVSRPTISGGLVVCILPAWPVGNDSYGSSVTVYTVQVSISNDGQNYSTEQSYTVFDGLCKTCSSSINSSCETKANTCSIDGRCFRAGEKCRSDESRTCVPSKCQTKWSVASSIGCSDGYENCT